MGTNGSQRDWKNDYDYADPVLANEFAAVSDELHAKCPVARSEIGEGYWIINRYDDVRAVAQDWETFSSTAGFLPNRPHGQPFWYPDECDPPLHDLVRDELNPFFGPKAMKGLEPEVRRHAENLVDKLGAEADIVTEFANPLPGMVFCDSFVGIPTEDLPALEEDLNMGLQGPVEERGQRIEAVIEYLDAFMKDRQNQPPRGDVVDTILKMEVEGYAEGDDGWYDRVGTMGQLCLGGIGTTGFSIATMLLHLAQNPDVTERIRGDFSLIPRAVEEFLRYACPDAQTGRRATQDTEVGGVKIKSGDYLLMNFAAANRDPSFAVNPHEVDIERFPNPHLVFGAGVHRCIGAYLARLEMKIGLEVWLERISSFELAGDSQPEFEIATTFIMKSLPMRLEHKSMALG